MASKKYYYIIIKVHAIAWTLMIIFLHSKAQLPYNLVRNYSFEYHSVCGSVGSGGADYWDGGNNNVNTQYSYDNACSSQACCGVPSNNQGGSWQYARTGEAYIGLTISAIMGNTNGRNYAQTKLSDSLKNNHCYYIEFYTNPVDDIKYANNNISMLIGDTAIITKSDHLVRANPQIQLYSNPIISDTMNWVKVGGIYTAHGGESYITIGNFKDDAHTDTLRIGGNYISAYYIDDVSVIPLDSMQLKADAGRDTTIVKGDSVWIGSRLCGLTNVVWYDAANNVIDTGAPGLWVKPTSNTFYVIEQNVCGQYSRDTVYVAVVPLPVVIKNYELRIKNGIQNAMENVWETSTEINVSHFNVQRSLDGVTFETVGMVKAKGAGKYSLTAPPPPEGGIEYFRLEVVDKNGALSYSEVKEIQLGINNYELRISPNPGKDFISISGGSVKEVMVSDVGGRVLLKSTEKKIDIRSLVSGTYVVQIETLNGNYSIHKFIKLPN